MVLATPRSAFRFHNGSNRRRLTQSTALALVALAMPGLAMAQALPSDGTVTSGSANISEPSTGQMVIDQSTDRAIINWGSYSVGAGGTVTYNQPHSNSATLNRVTGGATSEINGSIISNGQVHVVNPNGIFIGPSGNIQAGGGFVASTLGILDSDFNSGTLRYSNSSEGPAATTVENQGTITVGSGGFAALLGGRVHNSGTVTVPMGRIGFGAGEQATLDLTGDGFLQIGVPSRATGDGALVTNSGTASAQGGLIEMRAGTAREAVRNAINMSGVVEARSVSMSNGKIHLGGGDGGIVQVSGRVTTQSVLAPPPGAPESSPRPVARGGIINITGHDVQLAGATLDASGLGGGVIGIGAEFTEFESTSDSVSWTFFEGRGSATSDAATSFNVSADGALRGGLVYFHARQGANVAGNFNATSTETHGGDVIIDSDAGLTFTGFFDGRAPNAPEGWLELYAPEVTVPGTISAELLMETLARGRVRLATYPAGENPNETDSGNLFINSPLSWDSGNSLQLVANNDLFMNASIDAPGARLRVAARGFQTNSGNLTSFGNILADANSGPVGRIFADPSIDINVGRFDLDEGLFYQNAMGGTLGAFNVGEEFNISPGGDFPQPDQTRFIRVQNGDGSAANPFILTDIFGVLGAVPGGEFTRTAHFQLGNSITVTPEQSQVEAELPDNDLAFYGTFDGAGNAIDFANVEGVDRGLFELLGGGSVVRNLDILNWSLGVDTAQDGGEGGGILALATAPGAVIDNVRTSGNIVFDGQSLSGSFGGLVGFNMGTITRAVTDVNIFGTIAADATSTSESALPDFYGIGGIAGTNIGTISQSAALGSINVTNNSPNITFLEVGGLVGEHGDDPFVSEAIDFLSQFGSGGPVPTVIEDSYAQVPITVTDNSGGSTSVLVGGLVGWAEDPITRSYAAAPISVTKDGVVVTTQSEGVGGIAGENIIGDLGTNFFDSEVAGVTLSGNATDGNGVTTQQLQSPDFVNLAGPLGWDFGNFWFPGNGFTYPTNTANAGDFLQIAGAELPPIIIPPAFLAEALPDAEDGGDLLGQSTAVLSAAEVNDQVAVLAQALRDSVTNCDAGTGVEELLACLSEGLNDFAVQLDQISADLPPELANVSTIIQNVRAEVDVIRTQTTANLAAAATPAERTAVARAAVTQVQTSLQAAASEVRAAVDLIDTGDAALDVEQRETVTRVADALEDVGSDLVDVAEL